MYKFFYRDYCEGKSIDSAKPSTARLEQIVHSMDRVLHMPDNFFGVTNDKESDAAVLTDLASCLAMVRGLDGSEDFDTLLTEQ